MLTPWDYVYASKAFFLQLIHLQFDTLLDLFMWSQNDGPQTRMHTGSADAW